MTIEPIKEILAKSATEHGISSAESFLKKLLGPAIEEAGQILKDQVHIYRFKNQVRMINKTQSILKEARIVPGSVPIRTLLPLLEGAAFEDDNSMLDKWAGLLASAASSKEDKLSHPSFPRILCEIAPREALMLDKLFATNSEPNWDVFRSDLAKELKISIESVNEAYGNLTRLGLCHIIGKASGSAIKVSTFGRFFLTAVYGPGKAD